MYCARELEQAAEKSSLICLACEHRCSIAPGKTGFCRVRGNQEGRLYTRMYGRPSALNMDPIEKKPLYHVLPGSEVLSTGTLGCNMICKWCQNCTIAAPAGSFIERHEQKPVMSPDSLTDYAVQQQASGIAFTYNEPTVWIEYAHDSALRAREKNLITVWVSNGYLTPDAWRYISPQLTAANIDLKAFRDDTHRRFTGTRLQPVLDSISYLHDQTDIWLEVTMLIIPEVNDDPDEIRAACRFLSSVSPDIPLHFSAFFPAHRMRDHMPTRKQTLVDARNIAREEGMRFVYLGNTDDSADIICPDCGSRALIRGRRGWSGPTGAFSGTCPGCGRQIPGIWRTDSSAYTDTKGGRR
ncbi:MAG: AmmeMemoRadiSam system radical SAM enzyme [Spirochaeta sp.]